MRSPLLVEGEGVSDMEWPCSVAEEKRTVSDASSAGSGDQAGAAGEPVRWLGYLWRTRRELHLAATAGRGSSRPPHALPASLMPFP